MSAFARAPNAKSAKQASTATRTGERMTCPLEVFCAAKDWCITSRDRKGAGESCPTLTRSLAVAARSKAPVRSRAPREEDVRPAGLADDARRRVQERPLLRVVVEAAAGRVRG